MAGEDKRSISIAGHRTSLSLEPEFWSWLQRFAKAEARSVASLVAEIDEARGSRNLSSAIRIWVLDRLSAQQKSIASRS